MEQYIHYGHKAFDPEKFQGIKNAPMLPKPNGGLWASPVDTEYGWIDWCEAENFRECSQDNSFAFALKGNAKVYHIRSVSDVKNMPLINNGITTWYTPDFKKMLADGWDAIELHLSECGELYWALYGWDCDCILILNKDIIEYRTPPQGGRRRPEGHRSGNRFVALFLFWRLLWRYTNWQKKRSSETCLTRQH